MGYRPVFAGLRITCSGSSRPRPAAKVWALRATLVKLQEKAGDVSPADSLPPFPVVPWRRWQITESGVALGRLRSGRPCLADLT